MFGKISNNCNYYGVNMQKGFMVLFLILFCYILRINATVKTDGIDLFTGKASFDHSLFALSGRGEMDVTLTLKYSSANAEDAWERNDKAPTGSFGLGWSMNFGAILTAHKNTVDIEDDQYVWLSSNGTSHRILKKVVGEETTFYIEQCPYWRIDRITTTVGTDPNTYDIVTGWMLIDMSGNRYFYGDNDVPPPAGDPRNATRYTFAWPQSGFIGNGTADNPVLYPVCWDLRMIRDDNGNTITFAYEQTTEKIFNSNIEYTKESHLVKITNPEGAYILFDWQPKSAGEFVDPYTFDEEPDGFQEIMNTVLTEKISIYNENDELINTFDFCYKKIRENLEDKLGGDHYTKSLLTEIIQSNNTRVESRYVFDYYDDEEKAKKDPENYCYGALKTIQNDLCGKATYEYKKQEIAGLSKTFEGFGAQNRLSSRYPGVLSDGTEFIVVKKWQQVWLYQWNGWKWKEMKIGEYASGSNLGIAELKEISCGLDYFVVWTYHMEDDPNGDDIKCADGIIVFSYDNGVWKQTRDYEEIDNISCGSNSIKAGAKFFIVQTGNHIYTYYWNSSSWIRNIYGGTGDIGQKTALGIDFFAYNNNGESDLSIWQWNGRTNQFEQSQFDMRKNGLRVNNNYIAGWQGNEIEILNWDGNEWSSTFSKSWKNDIKSYAGDGFTGIIHDDKEIQLFNWTGNEWTLAKKIKNVRSGEKWDPYSKNSADSVFMVQGNNFNITSYPRVIWRWGWSFLGLYILDVTQAGNVRIDNWWDGEWNETFKGRWGGSFKSKRFLPGADYSLCFYGFLQNEVMKTPYHPEYPIVWDGKTWNPEKNIDIHGEPTDVGEVAASGYLTIGKNTTVSEDLFITGTQTEIQSHRKINGSFKGVVDAYVVCKTIVNDGFTDKNVETVITYEPQHSTFDTRGGLPRFKKATVASPGAGKTVYHFFNGYSDDNYTEQEELNSDYEKLGSLVYLQEDFSETGKLVGSTSREFEVYKNETDWPTGLYDIRLTKKTDNTKGVASSYEITSFEDGNGLPAGIEKTNSNGEKLIETREYAFTRYTDMGADGAHILTPVCENVFYKDEQDATTVKAATAAVWSVALKVGTWKQEKTFAWNGESSYEDYWTSDDDWQPTGENLFFDDHGYLMTETGSDIDLKYSKIRGVKNTLPSAQITNAKFHECAIFTGDFDDNPTENTCYDENELWEKGGTTLSSDMQHFGEKSISVPIGADGISGTARGLDPEKDYLFTAWVYPSRDCDGGNYIALSFEKTPATTPLPPEVRFETLLSGSNPDGGWQKISALVSKEFLAGMDPSQYREEDNNYLKFTLNGTNVGFYVDDLRFHPNKALVRTTYYDQLRRQMIASVDYNGNVESVRYDDQGRPVLWLDNKGRELARREYCLARCNTKEGDGSLKSLQVETVMQTDALDVDAVSKEYTLFYDNSIENVTVQAEAQHEEAKLRYRINEGAWVEQLCACNLEIPLALTPGVQYKVDNVGVAPSGLDDDNVMYTIYITRSANCWVAVGSGSSAAPNGVLEAQMVVAQNTPYSAFADAGGTLRSRMYSMNTWSDIADVSSVESGDISMATYGTEPYIAYAHIENGDQVCVKKYNGSTWAPVMVGASTTVSPDAAKSTTIKVGSGGIPYVAYIGDLHLEPNNSGPEVDERLIVKKYESGDWIAATGSWSTLAASDESAIESVLGISPAGVVYIAYIAVDTDKDSNLDDSDGRIIVKRLVGAAWVQVGDWVSGPPVADCQQLSIGFMGEMPCVAYAEASFSTSGSIQSVDNADGLVVRVKVYNEMESWLPPFRQDIPANYSHWVHIGPQELFRVSQEDAFELISDASSLYLQFTNRDNKYLMTTITWNGNNWRSVGNPGFALSTASGGDDRFNAFVAGDDLYASFVNKMQSGEQGVYTYDLTESCSDATLCNLYIVNIDGTFVPDFRQYILNYSLEVENNVSTITFNPVVCTGSGTVNVYVNDRPTSFPVDLIVGENRVAMEVVSADGEARKRYTVTVTRKASSFAALCNFTIYSENTIDDEDEIDYTPAFDVDVPDYAVSGDFPGEYLYVRPVNNGNSTIYVNGKPIGSGLTTRPIELYFGENTIPIKVVAADNVTSNTYNLTVTTPVPSTAGLTGIFTTAGTLEPSFSMQTFNYTVEVPYATSQIQFTPTSSGAVITTNDGVEIPSGGQTDPFDLQIGDQNEILFIGSEASGSKGVLYTVTVIREPGETTQLMFLSILDDTDPGATVPLTPTFSPKHLSYSALVANSIRAIRITPTADISSTIVISGALTSTPSGSEHPVALNEGVNTITISVSDGTEVADYQLSITRQSSVTPDAGVISFSQATKEVDEDEGTFTISVTIDKAVSSEVTVDYQVPGEGTASIGQDFDLPAGMLTFEKCEQTKEIEVTIIDDQEIDPDEWFKIVLSNPTPAGIVAVPTNGAEMICTIRDNDFPTVAFDARQSSEFENVADAGVTVTLSEPLSKPVTVYLTFEVSPQGSPNYDITGTKVVFMPGDPLTQPVPVQIVDNQIYEGDESFNVRIVNVDNAAIGEMELHTHRIKDDENPQPTVYFTARSGSGPESENYPAVTAVMYPAPAGNVTVPFTLSGTATGSDYTCENASQQLVFSSAVTSNTVLLNIVNDAVPEPPEMIVITLSTPLSEATLGDPSVFTYTITDENSTVRYVQANITNTGNGTDWGDGKAYKYLQNALTEARDFPGTVTEIRVAAGAYYTDVDWVSRPFGSDDVNGTFAMIDGVTLKGGYPANGGVARDWIANVSILSGDIEQTAPEAGSRALHVLTGANATLDGFTVEWGSADNSGGVNNAIGGAMLNLSCTPYIVNCRFTKNYSMDRGVVFCVEGTSALTIENCVFEDNPPNSENYGAALFCYGMDLTVNNCTFERNHGIRGGAICFDGGDSPYKSITISGSGFNTNKGVRGGGAVLINNSVNVSISECTFNENVTTWGGPGGGVEIIGENTEATITDTRFTSNHLTTDESSYGGALCYNAGGKLSMTNCLLHSNTALHGSGVYTKATENEFINTVFYRNAGTQDGGGVTIDGGTGNHTFVNCVIADHGADQGAGIFSSVPASAYFCFYNCTFYDNWGGAGAGIYFGYTATPANQPEITNSIIWYIPGHATGAFYPGTSTPVVSGCCIQGYTSPPEVDPPGFYNTANIAGPDGDFGTYDDGLQLRAGSRCINAGMPYGDMSMFPVNGDGDPIDISKNLRLNGIIDVGAYEKTGAGGPTPRYVRANISTPAEPGIPGAGQNWDNAYGYLQDALKEAQDFPGTVSEIRVAAGYYYPDVDWTSRPDGTDDYNETFAMVEGVNLSGGYPADGGDARDWITNETVLSGNIHQAPLQQNSAHVVTGANATIDGFSIEEGGSEYSGGGSYSTEGGGMLSEGCAPYIINCRFTKNHAVSMGAALYCGDGSGDVIVENCIFEDNPYHEYLMDGLRGIAIGSENTNLSVIGCTFRENQLVGSGKSTIGGAIYFSGGTAPYKSLNINRCNFYQNSVEYDGGAIFVYNYGSFNISNDCQFGNNVSNRDGGAIYLFGDASSVPTFEYCDFNSNEAASEGGAVFIVNSASQMNGMSFINNSCGEDNGGGAIFYSNCTGNHIRIGVTMSGNTAHGVEDETNCE